MFRSASDEDSEAVELAYEDLMARWSSRTIEVPEDANLDLL
jgi:adenine-specific DNA methylase